MKKYISKEKIEEVKTEVRKNFIIKELKNVGKICEYIIQNDPKRELTHEKIAEIVVELKNEVDLECKCTEKCVAYYRNNLKGTKDKAENNRPAVKSIEPDKNQELYEKEEETNFQDIVTSESVSENLIILHEKAEPKPEQLEKNGNKYWKRNPINAAEAIALAKYSCECQINSTHETFISKKTDKNFVEAHHIIPMSYQGSFDISLDVHSNIVALCPNCHRAIHNSITEKQKELLEILFNNRKHQLLNQGINISFEELINLYL